MRTSLLGWCSHDNGHPATQVVLIIPGNNVTTNSRVSPGSQTSGGKEEKRPDKSKSGRTEKFAVESYIGSGE